MQSLLMDSRCAKIWWMARGMTPATTDRSRPSALSRSPPCRHAASQPLLGAMAPVLVRPSGRWGSRRSSGHQASR